MTVHLYEGLFLLDSNRFATDSEGVQNTLLALLKRVEADVVAARPWQEAKLTYPIKGHRKGLYFLVMFRMEGGNIPELNRLCSLSEDILRILVINHPQVIFDAMVESLASNDGALHSPEKKIDPRSERGERGGRDRDEMAAEFSDR